MHIKKSLFNCYFHEAVVAFHSMKLTYHKSIFPSSLISVIKRECSLFGYSLQLQEHKSVYVS